MNNLDKKIVREVIIDQEEIHKIEDIGIDLRSRGKNNNLDISIEEAGSTFRDKSRLVGNSKPRRFNFGGNSGNGSKISNGGLFNKKDDKL